jgi:ATP-dependent Clp protease ATP-binding subunit ClpA
MRAVEMPIPSADHGERLCRLAEGAARADDPGAALRMLSELRRELDAFVGMQVRRSLAAGRSFGEVARALGISRQAAHRRYRELAPVRPGAPRRLVATEETRQVVQGARAETLAAGAPAAGSREVLLGILRTECGAAQALRSEGVTLEKARACAPRVDSGGDGDSSSLERIVRRARRVAVARGDGCVHPEHLLLAAIADPDGGASGTLAALGATPLAIRARLGSRQTATIPHTSTLLNRFISRAPEDATGAAGPKLTTPRRSGDDDETPVTR